jgi:hypothetical protein
VGTKSGVERKDMNETAIPSSIISTRATNAVMTLGNHLMEMRTLLECSVEMLSRLEVVKDQDPENPFVIIRFPEPDHFKETLASLKEAVAHLDERAVNPEEGPPPEIKGLISDLLGKIERDLSNKEERGG